jgi:hypothetical protein
MPIPMPRIVTADDLSPLTVGYALLIITVLNRCGGLHEENPHGYDH